MSLVTLFVEFLVRERQHEDQVLALISCHILACHDSVMLTQVRVDAVSARYSELFVGVTGIPPDQLLVTNGSIDLKDPVIVGPSFVLHQGETVSFHGYSTNKWLCGLVFLHFFSC